MKINFENLKNILKIFEKIIEYTGKFTGHPSKPAPRPPREHRYRSKSPPKSPPESREDPRVKKIGNRKGRRRAGGPFIISASFFAFPHFYSAGGINYRRHPEAGTLFFPKKKEQSLVCSFLVPITLISKTPFFFMSSPAPKNLISRSNTAFISFFFPVFRSHVFFEAQAHPAHG